MPYEPKAPRLCHCALCGVEIPVDNGLKRPLKRPNKFCNTRHKLEYYKNLKLTAVQQKTLTLVSEGQGFYSHALWAMSDKNPKRVMPFIRVVSSTKFELTDFGQKFIETRA